MTLVSQNTGVGELAGEVGVAHPLGGAQVQQGERPVLDLQGLVLVVGGHLLDRVRGGVVSPRRRSRRQRRHDGQGDHDADPAHHQPSRALGS
jgi:hypothetical protein